MTIPTAQCGRESPQQPVAESFNSMISWKWAKFEELSALEVYDLLKLRQVVFAVEQNCAYLDADGKDIEAWHLLGMKSLGNGSHELVAYLRVLSPGLRFPEHAIGRVVTAPSTRGQGTGRTLMMKALECIEAEFGAVPIRISAQAYLEKFYRSLGFMVVGEPYLEDKIPHIEMLKQ